MNLKRMNLRLMALSLCAVMCGCSLFLNSTQAPSSASLSQRDCDNSSTISKSNVSVAENNAECYVEYYAYLFSDTEIENSEDIAKSKNLINILLSSAYEYFNRQSFLEVYKDEFEYTHAKLTWENIKWTASNLYGIENMTTEKYNAKAPDYYQISEEDGFIDFVPMEFFDIDYNKCEIVSRSNENNLYTFEINVFVSPDLGEEIINKGIYVYKLEESHNGVFKLISIKSK